MNELVRERPTSDWAIPEIEEQLATIMAAASPGFEAYGRHFGELWRHGLECRSGGKMLRPRLLVGAFDALHADVEPPRSLRRSAIRIAAAVELLHLSFLLHDDVIDGDLMRRGMPNVIGRLFAEAAGATVEARLHWARSNGILLGNLILSKVHQVFARESVSESQRTRLLELLDRAIFESVAGEQYDVGLGHGIIASDLPTVLEMSRLKTATYTFELPLRGAAVLAGAGGETEETLGEIARHLGVAFQLQDDLMSAFGESSEHGKDAFSDFREAKETPLIAYARMTSAWSCISPLLGADDFSEAHGNEIRALLAKCGAEEFIRDMVDDRMRAATALVTCGALSMSPRLSEFLRGIIGSLDGRTA